MTNKEKFNAGQPFIIDRYVIGNSRFKVIDSYVYQVILNSDDSEMLFDKADKQFRIVYQNEEVVTGWNFILDTRVNVSVSFNEMNFDLPINNK